MKNVDELTKVLQAEADLADALLTIIEDKQQALVHFQPDGLAQAVERERELLKPIQELERERTQIVSRLAREVKTPDGLAERLTVSELAKYVEPEPGRKLSVLAARLRKTASRIQHRNQQNHVLLESCSRFVKNTLRIVTDDYSRQLVDHTI
jgi:flagellar biosynthesis/type III secretory pathway chaperone